MGHRQRQRLPNLFHRPLRICAVLSRQSAAAGMMRDFHQWQAGDSEELRFSPTQFHKNRLAQGHRRLSALLKFDGIVDTPRCARPSGPQSGDYSITPANEFLHH